MYFVLTHGWGRDPEKHIITEYYHYKDAKKALNALFDMYETLFESGTGPDKTFTCILRQKGVESNGLN